MGCLLYADAIILLNPEVGSLQAMLDKCFEVSRSLSLQFNVSKSHCMIIGKMYKAKVGPVLLGSQQIEWCNCIKYLGTYLQCS